MENPDFASYTKRTRKRNQIGTRFLPACLKVIYIERCKESVIIIVSTQFLSPISSCGTCLLT